MAKFNINENHSDHELISDIFEACQAWIDVGGGFGATSSITGDGAVEAAEKRFSALHSNRPALLVPSATYGLYSALKAVSVRAGSLVCCPDYDWPSSLGAIRALGATPLLIPVFDQTLTIDPAALRKLDLSNISAIIATHIHGIPADIPAIREAIGQDIPIIEDCSQAFGSELDGQPVGALGDIAVFSFGPGKALYAGEGGMIVTRDWALYEKVIRETAHPIRQLIGGVGNDVKFTNFSIRPHPITAIMLLHALDAFERSNSNENFTRMSDKLSKIEGITLIGMDDRRLNSSNRIPVYYMGGLNTLPEWCILTPSGALNLWKLKSSDKPVYLAELDV